jgi:tetratricopeptide (TPR) repeat protein
LRSAKHARERSNSGTDIHGDRIREQDDARSKAAEAKSAAAIKVGREAISAETRIAVRTGRRGRVVAGIAVLVLGGGLIVYQLGVVLLTWMECNHEWPDWDLSIRACTELIRQNLRGAGAYYNRAYAYGNKGDAVRAFADLNKAIELDPKYNDAYLARTSYFEDKKEYDKAIADYTKAIEIDPNKGYVYSNRGTAYLRKKDYDRAIADYTKAIEFNPKWADDYYDYRGIAYDAKGEHGLAISDYNKAIEIDTKRIEDDLKNNPSYASRSLSYASRGKVYGHKKEYDLAIADFNKAIEIEPAYGVHYYDRGIVYEALGRKNEAIADYRRAPNVQESKDGLKRLGASP